jgi:hypothetical protein
MNEFGIHGSFGSGDSYNPFDGGFGSASTLPVFGGSTPVEITSTAAVDNTPSKASSSSSSSATSSSGSGWGGVFQNAVSTGLGWLGGLAQIDLFGKAADNGLIAGSNQSTQTNQTNQTAYPTGTSSSSASGGLPSWAMPVAGGALVLMVLFVLLKD